MDNWYKEALKRARKAYDSEAVSPTQKQMLADIFPELVGSEDERIRKYLIWYVKKAGCGCGLFDSIHTREAILGYLERQKELKPKMTPKWLYRLEFKDSSCGLWYDGSGKWCFESGIGSIGGCKTKTLPMDYDARYKQDGRDWFSSCSQKEDLMHWYSLEDAKELIAKGFVFTRYLATEYHEYPQQTVFIKETALYREEIDIFDLFKQQKQEWSEEDERMLKEIISFFKDGSVKLQHDLDLYAGFLEKKLKSLRLQPLRRDTYYDIIHSILAMLKDRDFTQITPEHRVSLLNDIRVKCKNADECAKILDEPQWKPANEQMKAFEESLMSVAYTENKIILESLYEQLKKL